jgi:hypothetical protein
VHTEITVPKEIERAIGGPGSVPGVWRSVFPFVAETTRHLGETGTHEAAIFWPSNTLDVLVLLGSNALDTTDVSSTGVGVPGQYSSSMFKWVEELSRVQSLEATPTVFELQPLMCPDLRVVDDSIDLVSRHTVSWLERHHDTILVIANHLTARLFFYDDLFSAPTASQRGEIRCRLPWDLESRGKMVAHLARRTVLFVATCEGVQTEIDALLMPSTPKSSPRT